MPTHNKKRPSKKLPIRGSRKKRVRYIKLIGSVGAVPKITEKLIKDIVDLVLEGLPINRSCDYMGISEQAFYNWKKQGEEYLRQIAEGLEPENPGHEVHAIFVQAVVRAKAEWQLEIIRRSMQTESKHSATWVRDMTLLERRDRANWSRSEILQVTETSILPDEAYL